MVNETMIRGLAGLLKRIYTLPKINKLVRAMENANISRLSLSEYECAYPGEFYERAEERGYEFVDGDYVAMAYFLALIIDSGVDYVGDNIFNEYQVDDFKKKIVEVYSNINSPVLDYSMYIIFNDETYLDTFRGKELSLKDIVYVLALGDTSIVDDNFDVIFAKDEASLSYLNILYEFLKDVDGDVADVTTVFEKLINGKPTKKIAKRFGGLGYEEYQLNLLATTLKTRWCEGKLKVQRAILACFKEIANLETPMDEWDKKMAKTLSFYKFDIAMYDKAVHTLAQGLDYEEVLDNCKCHSNWVALCESIPQHITFPSLVVDVINDKDMVAKVDVIKAHEGDRAKYWVSNNLEHFLKGDEVTKDYANNLIEVYEKLGFEMVEYVNSTIAKHLFSLGSRDVIECYNNGTISKSLCYDYVRPLNNKTKFLFIKNLYEASNWRGIRESFPWETFNRDGSSYSYCPEGLTIEETKEYHALLLETALACGDFKTMLPNIMFGNNAEITKIYSKEDLKFFEVNLRSIMESFSDSSWSSNWTRSRIKSCLHTYYLSEEEKLEIKRKKEEKEREEKRLQMEREDAEIKALLKSTFEVCVEKNFSIRETHSTIDRALSWRYTHRKCVLEFYKGLLTTTTLPKDDISWYYEVLGELVEYDALSISESISMLSNLTLVDNEDDESAA